MSLTQGTIWLTGASSGIGRSAALLLARENWTVAISARSEEALNELAKLDDRIHVYPMDVAQSEDRLHAYNAIRADHGPIDVLVNNAGYGIRGAVEEMDLSELRDLFDVNVFAPLALTKMVLPEMRQRRLGRIIMISSVVGKVAVPVSGAYSASKHALEAFSDALRIEINPWQLHVSLIEPGPIATEFSRVAKDSSTQRLEKKSSPYYRYYQRMLKSGMFKRSQYWDPGTVAEAILDSIQSANPRQRYPVHPAAVWLPRLKKILPGSFVDVLLGRKFGFATPAPWDQGEGSEG